jgi:glucose-1-phosphate thymidylyltransferase
VRSLEEKPLHPRSNWAVVGLYLYGPGVAERALTLKPSARGELEISDLNKIYLSEGKLIARPMGRGIAWLDTGTPKDLLDASNFVYAIETRQGLVIGSPEEAAYRMGYIDLEAFKGCVMAMPRSKYRRCLEPIIGQNLLSAKVQGPRLVSK